jgi:peptidyl-prolyl cis-trans isomerase C
MAREIAQRVRAGEDFASVRRELGDAMVAELPEGALRVETIRQYLGATVARTATRLEPGEVSDPVRGAAGYYVLQLRERLAGEIALFEEVRSEVRGEYLRDRGDAALRAYLAELRDAAEIRVLEPELAEP